MTWLTLETLTELGIVTLILGSILGLVNYFIIAPYRRYFDFRDQLPSEGIEISRTTHNINLPQSEYVEADKVMNGWLGQMNILKNRLVLNKYLKRFGIPSKEELDEAIKCTTFIRNAMGQQRFILDIYHNYQRLMEIFNINQ